MNDNDGYCKSCEKLADEIKQLQDHHRDSIGNWNLLCEDQTKEIEMLRQMVKDAAQALNEEERENERLEKRIESLLERIVDQESELDGKDREIERLRSNEAAVLKALADTDANCRKRFAWYREKIERLHEENTKLRGWFNVEAQHTGRLQRKLNTAEVEIERLREVLEAILEAHNAFHGGAVLSARFEALVREALGNKP